MRALVLLLLSTTAASAQITDVTEEMRHSKMADYARTCVIGPDVLKDLGGPAIWVEAKRHASDFLAPIYAYYPPPQWENDYTVVYDAIHNMMAAASILSESDFNRVGEVLESKIREACEQFE